MYPTIDLTTDLRIILTVYLTIDLAVVLTVYLTVNLTIAFFGNSPRAPRKISEADIQEYCFEISQTLGLEVMRVLWLCGVVGIAGVVLCAEVWEERQRGWGARSPLCGARTPAMHALNPKP